MTDTAIGRHLPSSKYIDFLSLAINPDDKIIITSDNQLTHKSVDSCCRSILCCLYCRCCERKDIAAQKLGVEYLRVHLINQFGVRALTSAELSSRIGLDRDSICVREARTLCEDLNIAYTNLSKQNRQVHYYYLSNCSISPPIESLSPSSGAIMTDLEEIPIASSYDSKYFTQLISSLQFTVVLSDSEIAFIVSQIVGEVRAGSSTLSESRIERIIIKILKENDYAIAKPSFLSTKIENHFHFNSIWNQYFGLTETDTSIEGIESFYLYCEEHFGKNIIKIAQQLAKVNLSKVQNITYTSMYTIYRIAEKLYKLDRLSVLNESDLDDTRTCNIWWENFSKLPIATNMDIAFIKYYFYENFGKKTVKAAAALCKINFSKTERVSSLDAIQLYKTIIMEYKKKEHVYAHMQQKYGDLSTRMAIGLIGYDSSESFLTTHTEGSVLLSLRTHTKKVSSFIADSLSDLKFSADCIRFHFLCYGEFRKDDKKREAEASEASLLWSQPKMYSFKDVKDALLAFPTQQKRSEKMNEMTEGVSRTNRSREELHNLAEGIFSRSIRPRALTHYEFEAIIAGAFMTHVSPHTEDISTWIPVPLAGTKLSSEIMNRVRLYPFSEWDLATLIAFYKASAKTHARGVSSKVATSLRGASSAMTVSTSSGLTSSPASSVTSPSVTSEPVTSTMRRGSLAPLSTSRSQPSAVGVSSGLSLTPPPPPSAFLYRTLSTIPDSPNGSSGTGLDSIPGTVAEKEKPAARGPL